MSEVGIYDDDRTILSRFDTMSDQSDRVKLSVGDKMSYSLLLTSANDGALILTPQKLICVLLISCDIPFCLPPVRQILTARTVTLCNFSG